MDFSGNVGEWQRNVSEGKAGKHRRMKVIEALNIKNCLLYTSPSPRDQRG